jgi:hypothetical protein
LKTNEAEDSHLSSKVKYESLILELLKVESGSQELLMPISDVTNIFLLLLWHFNFLDPIHSLDSPHWQCCHLLYLLFLSSLQLLILHLSIVPKLLLETASLAEADLDA